MEGDGEARRCPRWRPWTAAAEAETIAGMRCPHCQLDLNDPQPECPDCHFHIRDLDAELGEPPGRADAQVVDLAGALSAGGAERLRSHIAAWSART